MYKNSLFQKNMNAIQKTRTVKSAIFKMQLLELGSHDLSFGFTSEIGVSHLRCVQMLVNLEGCALVL